VMFVSVSFRFPSIASFVASRRGMAQLKDLKVRIATVATVSKLTASMKLVAATRLRGPEANMTLARNFWAATNSLADKFPSQVENEVFVLICSDRGLCGSVNNSLVRTVKRDLADKPHTPLFIVGDKGRAGLRQGYMDNFLYSATKIGKKSISLADSAAIVEALLTVEADALRFYSNRFNSILSFSNITRLIPTREGFKKLDLSAYEVEGEEETMINYYEHYLIALVYSSLIEHAATELATRMSAMDNASRNAVDLLKLLRIQYNRKRQEKITTELNEIVSGTESLKESD